VLHLCQKMQVMLLNDTRVSRTYRSKNKAPV
jgi:hypothetical protein